jgi:hypothetical protein
MRGLKHVFVSIPLVVLGLVASVIIRYLLDHFKIGTMRFWELQAGAVFVVFLGLLIEWVFGRGSYASGRGFEVIRHEKE